MQPRIELLAKVFEEEVNHRGGIKSQDLGEDEAADDGDAQGAAEFRTGAEADRER